MPPGAAGSPGQRVGAGHSDDKLSLRLNGELNIAYSEPEAVHALLERLFYPDFEASIKATEPFRVDWRNHIAELIVNQL